MEKNWIQDSLSFIVIITIEVIYKICNVRIIQLYKGSSFLIPQLNIVVEVGHEGHFFIMEKVAFIIDGGFTKQYKKTYKKFPTADDVENYIFENFSIPKTELQLPYRNLSHILL